MFHKPQIADYEDYLAYKEALGEVFNPRKERFGNATDIRVSKMILKDSLFDLVYSIALKVYDEKDFIESIAIGNDDIKDKIADIVREALE